LEGNLVQVEVNLSRDDISMRGGGPIPLIYFIVPPPTMGS